MSFMYERKKQSFVKLFKVYSLGVFNLQLLQYIAEQQQCEEDGPFYFVCRALL